MILALFSGKYKVFDAGNIITFNGESNVEMIVRPSAIFSFRIIIDFEENDGERSLERTVDEKERIIRIKCVNFGAGAGTAEPLELGMAGGRKMFLHLWVERISSSVFIRRVEYTVFIER